MNESSSRDRGGRRSTLRVIADYFGYGFRVVLGKQEPVQFKDLPRDLQWQQASLLLSLAVTLIGFFVDSAWVDQMLNVLVLTFVGSTWISIRRGKQDLLRFTSDWVGSVGPMR